MELTPRETIRFDRAFNRWSVIVFCGSTRVQYRQDGNTKTASVWKGMELQDRHWPFLDDPSDSEIIETAVRHARIADGSEWRYAQTGET